LVYSGSKVTVSNDGATIMRLLDIVHPAAKTLVDIAKSQDEEVLDHSVCVYCFLKMFSSQVGDGTTSVVVLACEFLTAAKVFVEEGLHPQVIIRGYRHAARLAREHIHKLAVKVAPKDSG
jgi:T-complex protein 1 subunit eta